MSTVTATPSEMPEFGFRTTESEVSETRERLTGFIRDRVEAAGADGVVVCLSGGIDSSVTAALATAALDRERVYGLVLPARKADDTGQFDAHLVADELGIGARTVHLAPLLDAFEDTVAPSVSAESDRVARGNALARLRAVTAYYAANTRNLLVCGTTNRTEWLLGYFTKFGDGAADIRPLADCYKTEVRALAADLGVPRTVREKPPSAGLWRDQTDAEELGAPYSLIDCILTKLVDEDLGIEGTAAELGVSVERVERYARMHLEAEHKRELAPTPKNDRERTDLFHELESRFREE
ncbi:NAD+ synthase [Halorarius halobius]|uniref:NAD+ synthase n=1 Tax=Halorarius halobius TaxID=2962671 RepID=UPI0020CBD1DB|nr:NAD+ synthase [Halorarius halobius]